MTEHGNETRSRKLLDSAGSMSSDNGDTLSSSPILTSGEEHAIMKEFMTVPRKLAYGMGHVLNDLAASMWFTYFILFYHMVLHISNSYAGLLVLIGQVADAMATPVVGYLCDNTENRYGGRKTWHLAGSIMVGVSLFFFWHQCLYCNEQPLQYQILYFACFIIVFQVGWATVQVSHLALIPQLTPDQNERVGLTSIRYSATICSNLAVFSAMIVLLATVNSGGGASGFSTSSKITPSDQWIFSGIALGIICFGSVFVAIFHVGTKEPSCRRRDAWNRPSPSSNRKLPVYVWFLNPQFYLVGVIYMSSRLVVNLTQVYSPLYILDSLGMNRLSVAFFPLVIYLSGLAVTFVLKRLNRFIGKYLVYLIGIILVLCAMVWIRFWPHIDDSNHHDSNHHGTDNFTESDLYDNEGFHLNPLPHSDITVNLIYGAGVLTGLGGTTLLVTSLSMVADLIGENCGSSAFVYGAMSFTDKLSNGIAIQVIQLLHPCKGSGSNVCCSQCSLYYRRVLSYVPSGACLLALGTLIVVWLMIMYKKNTPATPTHLEQSKPKHTIQCKVSQSNSYDESTPLLKA